MLHRKVHTNEIIESELPFQLIVEASIFELLTEFDDEPEEAFRVVVRHRQVSLSHEAPQVALRQEGCGEGHITAESAAAGHFWHKSHQS